MSDWTKSDGLWVKADTSAPIARPAPRLARPAPKPALAKPAPMDAQVKAVFIGIVLVILLVIGALSAGSKGSSSDPITSDCRTAYENSAEKQIGVGEKHYVDNCVHETKDLTNKIGELTR